MRIILKDDYLSYANALHTMGVDSLYDRRENLCLSFAKKCTKSQNSQVRSMFPPNDAQPTVETRNPEKFQVNMARTGRYKDSAVPYMQRMLNQMYWQYVMNMWRVKVQSEAGPLLR